MEQKCTNKNKILNGEIMKPDIIKETKGYSEKIDGYFGVYCPCGKTLYVKNPSKAMSVDIECPCGFTIHTLYTRYANT